MLDESGSGQKKVPEKEKIRAVLQKYVDRNVLTAKAADELSGKITSIIKAGLAEGENRT